MSTKLHNLWLCIFWARVKVSIVVNLWKDKYSGSLCGRHCLRNENENLSQNNNFIYLPLLAYFPTYTLYYYYYTETRERYILKIIIWCSVPLFLDKQSAKKVLKKNSHNLGGTIFKHMHTHILAHSTTQWVDRPTEVQ